VPNNADLEWLVNHLKTGNGSADAVPEPASALLLVFGSPLAVVVTKNWRRGKNR
jgi:hypothetical protein